MGKLVVRSLGILAIAWGILVQVSIVVDAGLLLIVKLAYVSLWEVAGIGLVLLKEWGRRCGVIVAMVGLALVLIFSIGTTAMVVATGFAGFHMSKWAWVPWVGLMLACHVAYMVILTRPAVKGEFRSKATTRTRT